LRCVDQIVIEVDGRTHGNVIVRPQHPDWRWNQEETPMRIALASLLCALAVPIVAQSPGTHAIA
jgi:hypothetical protein